ncbi:tetratricopeptide repeat protein [Helicobacter anatolicus]|uniref:ATP-dependent nuclease subunit B n=1 Tax=Helicobacter anatolicus TaxID=2905874 RepID=UPI001E440F72|nr:ATP-dependent nuclease subunit B [Helicobacter anatolicus]MCE3038847.1 ATP-dependent nuclease subunit B [Helicobacter anatolicus]
MIKNILRIFLIIIPLFAQINEDLQIFLGADALSNAEFKKARGIYADLYEKTKNIYYARELAIIDAGSGDLGSALQFALLYQNTTKDTKDLPTSKIIADSYIKKGEIQKAIILLESIIQQEESPMLDNILGTLYLNQKQLHKALVLLEKYYEFSNDEEALKKILAIHFTRNENHRVVERLQKFFENNWCSDEFCSKSIEIFKQFDKNDIANKIFKKHYEENPNIKNAKYYLQVLMNQEKFDKAEEIVRLYPFDDVLLLDLFVAQNKFKEASEQARKIYEQKNEAKFLAWSAIYYYQHHANINKEDLQKVINDLNQAIEYRKVQREVNKENANNEDAYFYNFLGYMLVEYNLDIMRGIELIKNALEIAPNAIAYIDSLAWGYYKLGDCSQAQNTFSNIPREQVGQDKELKKHFELIKKCYR